MVPRNEILRYLAEYLKVDEFSDYCVNGLQVEGNPIIARIATGVSVSDRFIQAALEIDAQMLLVHHGLFWKGTQHPFALTGVIRKRVKKLLDNNLNLVGYHLPLDAHDQVGNNAIILKNLGLTPVSTVDVGSIGEFPEEIPFPELLDRLNGILPSPAMALPCGIENVKRVGIISGGAPNMVETVAAMDCDTFITGEANEPLPRLVEELNLNFIAAGHYNSERFGPLALGDHLARHFDLTVEFIDIENPV